MALLLGVLGASPAFAQAAADPAAAQALFEQARTLMAQKRFADACPKFEESQRLDPGGGTLLNIASCYEADGKTATAWAHYKEAAEAARREGRHEREEYAMKHIKDLEPKLSRLTVSVGASADVQGLVVARDGTPIGKAAWGVPMPVDPGPHKITAVITGHATWEQVVNIGPSGDSKSIAVDHLGPETSPSAEAPEKAGEPSEGGTTRRTMGFVVGGAGLVGLGIGAAFGASAISKRKHSNEICSSDVCSLAQAEAVSLNNDAKSAAHASDIALGVGAVGVVVGVILIVTGGRPSKAPAAANVGFMAGPTSLGISGRW